MQCSYVFPELFSGLIKHAIYIISRRLIRVFYSKLHKSKGKLCPYKSRGRFLESEAASKIVTVVSTAKMQSILHPGNQPLDCL